jgi:hypothetical protein
MTTDRRRALLVALVVATSIVGACGSGDGAPVGTADPATTSAATGSTGSTGSTGPTGPTGSPSTSGSATASPTSDPVAATATSTTRPNPAATVPAAPATTAAGAAVSTTLGDLLTEDEVAEVERALDELDVLLGEIDADLAGAPDP